MHSRGIFMLQRDKLPFVNSNFMIARVQNMLLYFFILAVVVVLAGVPDLGVLLFVVLLLVRLLLDYTLFPCLLSLSVHFLLYSSIIASTPFLHDDNC